jgi:hypothetical protein
MTTPAGLTANGGGGGGGGGLALAKSLARVEELEELHERAARENAELRQKLASLGERAAATAAQAARDRAVEREQRAELEERLSEMEVSVKVRGAGRGGKRPRPLFFSRASCAI